MKRLLLVAALLVSPALAAPLVTVSGDNNVLPASTTNPIPVSLNGGSGGNVSVLSTVQPTGVALASSTSITAAIPAISTLVTLTAASTSVTIMNLSDTANLHINLNSAGTATTSNFAIPPGAGFNYSGVPAIISFKIIGSAAAGNYGVIAH